MVPVEFINHKWYWIVWTTEGYAVQERDLIKFPENMGLGWYAVTDPEHLNYVRPKTQLAEPREKPPSEASEPEVFEDARRTVVVVEPPERPPPTTDKERTIREWADIDDAARAAILASETERVLALPETEMMSIIPGMPYRHQGEGFAPASTSIGGLRATPALV